ncbi:SDR family NAD(P)-dependent oxidoreductase [Candidatus Woesearchaeota archaeon]|nr:SDR family NAD(P)-dependent oxidoreductase [Candidatus Woesearchaeota archaeon]MBT4731480.1 SDR family NAD(P)-dependent oxidoreductase [Candidatus Woesearchaeota archaeon]
MKNILITGISSGIGKALAHRYGLSGNRIYGISRDERKVDGFIKHIECDIEKVYEISYKLSNLLNGVKKIETVFLNAGVLGQIDFLNEVSMTELERVLTINTLSNKMIVDYLITNNIKVKQVVAISSGASKNAYTGWGAYSISKAALNMMMKVYAEEQPDIHFLSVSPGPVDTPMQDFINKNIDGRKYKWKKKFSDMKKNNDLPKASWVADNLHQTMPTLKKYKSGSFLDLRNLQFLI